MKKLNPCIKYNVSQKTFIKEYLKAPDHNKWQKNSPKTHKEIKDHIRATLKANQNNICAYCGIDAELRGGPEIEHFAPKSKHPEWLYLKENLLLACHACNKFEQKGEAETVILKNINYKKCVFSIIHPYFDDPNDYFDFDIGVIKIKKNAPDRKKAEKTIDLFDLNSSYLTGLRCGLILINMKIAAGPNSDKEKELIDKITSYHIFGNTN